MSWGRREPKRIPGRRIKTMADFCRALDRGQYIFFRGKCFHPKVLANWSVAVVRRILSNSPTSYYSFLLAKPNPKRVVANPIHYGEVLDQDFEVQPASQPCTAAARAARQTSE